MLGSRSGGRWAGVEAFYTAEYVLLRMNTSTPKTKLTLSIDRTLLQEAKEASEERQIPLSRLVENYLRFLARREAYCFKCGESFPLSAAKNCPKCGWLLCPHCDVCRCGLGEEAATTAYHMRRTLEGLLGGREVD